MRIFILLVVLGASTFADAQCSRKRLQLSKASGTIFSPDYPKTYDIWEECGWRVSSQLKDYAVVLDVKEINMVYQSFRGRKRCSGELHFNDKSLDCDSTSPFCNIYTTSSDCNEVASKYSSCTKKSMSSNGVEIDLETRTFFTATTQRFKIEYEILDCSKRTTTTTKTTTTSTTPPTRAPTTKKFSSTTATKPTETTEIAGINATSYTLRNLTSNFTLSPGGKAASSQLNAASIVVPLILIVLVIVAVLVAWRFIYRKRPRKSVGGHENVYAAYASENNSSPGTSAYKEWGHGQADQTTAPGITSTSIYEDIGGPSTYAVADQMMPSHTGYEFADKGYVDLDNNYAMAGCPENEYELTAAAVNQDSTQAVGNPYEVADTGHESTGGGYAMATNGAYEFEGDFATEGVYESAG